jgi:hypothetical protein
MRKGHEMARKKAVETEFRVEEDAVIHMPTNARFVAHSGREDIHQYSLGHLGSVLPNGDDYEEDSVWEIARRLMNERLKRT